MANQCSFDCFMLDDSFPEDTLKDIHLTWGDFGGTIVCVVSNNKQEFDLLRKFGWTIIIVGEFSLLS